MRARTALAAAAIPSFLLLSACGGGDKVTAQLQQALRAARLTPDEKDDKHLPCAVSFPRFYEAGKGSPRTRERIVASLTAAGWKTAVSGGADESHLTSDDDWEVFVTREHATGDDGKTYEILDVVASCIDHAADNLFSQ
ncbi:hypothetical protein ACWERV_31365 [Streptomyces sp. NPDC004031]